MTSSFIFAGVAGLGAYLLGSVPFGILLTKLAGAGDLRQIGSGNIGATNVLRTGRKGLAAATLLLDLLKGFAAVWLARYFFGADGGDFALPVQCAALGAVLGHCFPIFLGFKGGKGVATYAGVCFGLAWPLGAIYALCWIGILLLSKISSAGGLAAAAALPLAAIFTGRAEFALLLLLISALVTARHHANIRRLLKGEEPRIGRKKE